MQKRAAARTLVPAALQRSERERSSVHPAHAAAAARRRAGFLLLLGDVADERFGRQQQRSDRGGVLERRAHHLGRIDDAGLHQVLVLLGLSIEAGLVVELLDPLHDDRTFVARVGSDPPHRLFDRARDDVEADLLVAFELQAVEHLARAHQRNTAAGHDALFDGRLGRVHRVFDPRLLLLHLGLGGCTDLDDGHAADELREPLLQLLTVVVGGRVLDLRADLLHAPLDGVRAAAALDDRRVVLVDRDLLGLAEVFELDVLELEAEVFRDGLAAGEDGDVLQHGLAAITEPGRLHGRSLQRAAQLVHDERCERLALDVFRDDQQRAAAAGHLLEHREQILHRADLLLVNQDDRILQNDFHPLGVGHEVGRQVAAIELHALDDVERGLERLGFFNRDDAILADLLHRLGDDRADRLVVVRRDRPDLRDHVALHRLALLLQGLDDRLNGLLDAALQLHRIGAGDDVLGAFAVDRLREHGCRRRAVACDVRRLARHFAHHLCAHVLERILQLDLFRHGHAVLGDRGRAELLVEDDVAALRPERHLDRVGQLVDAAQDRLARLLTVDNLLCHVWNSRESIPGREARGV